MKVNGVGDTTSLSFPLEVEDGWPPVAVESLQFRREDDGYVVLVPPLFVKDLSVGDVIDVKLDALNQVQDWVHVDRSARSTVWLLRMAYSGTVTEALAQLRALGCNTVALEEAGIYSLDIPESLGMQAVDSVLAHLDHDCVAVAFPSMRHPEMGSQGS